MASKRWPEWMTSRDKALCALEISFSELDALCSTVETAMHPSTRGTILSWIWKLEDMLADDYASPLLQAKLIKAKLANERAMRIELVMQLDQAQFQASAVGWLSVDDEAIPPDADEAIPPDADEAILWHRSRNVFLEIGKYRRPLNSPQRRIEVFQMI